jgi:O-antigen/teichoic acid export membrane protein
LTQVTTPDTGPQLRPLDIPGLILAVSKLSAAELLRVAAAALLSIYLARRLGTAAFGLWTLAIATTAYPLALVEAGLTWIGTREIAHDRAGVRPLARTIVKLRLALAAGGLLILGAFVLISPWPAIQKTVVLLASGSLLTTAVTLDWVFYGLERPSIAAAATVTRTLVFTGAALAFVRHADRVWLVPVTQIAGELAAACLIGFAYRRQVQPAPPGAHALSARALIAQAAPLTLSQLLRAVTVWSSVTIISVFASPVAVGQFGAAQRLTQLVLGFATLYFYGYLPLASRASREGPDATHELISRSLGLTARVTLPFAVAATLLATDIVTFVFGDAYADAGGVLEILAWTVPVVIAGGHFRHTLIAARQTRHDLYAVAAGAAATLALNLALVPTLGSRGAAIAPLVGEAALTLTAIALVRRHVGRMVPVRGLMGVAAPVAAMAAAILLARHYGFVVALASGAATYAFASLAAHRFLPARLSPRIY